MKKILSKEYSNMAELRQELQACLGHDFPPTTAELPGELKEDPICDRSCSSCRLFSSCMEKGVAFSEIGCDHFVHQGFDGERMAVFNGIHLFLHGSLAYIYEFGYEREFASLDNMYSIFGHIRRPSYAVRRKPDRLEIVLWDRQVIGTIPINKGGE